eukprot:1865771-Amphidinium_carterae.1
MTDLHKGTSFTKKLRCFAFLFLFSGKRELKVSAVVQACVGKTNSATIQNTPQGCFLCSSRGRSSKIPAAPFEIGGKVPIE